MAKWYARLGMPAAVAGLVLALAAGALAPATFAAEKEKKQSLTEDVAKKLQPAQDAGNKGDLDNCIKLANEAVAASKKPYDKETSLKILRWCYGKKNDLVSYADVTEQLLDIESLPQEDRLASYKPLAQIYYQQKNFEKAEKYAKLWGSSANSSEAYHLLMAIYYSQQDCQNAAVAQEKENELEKAAGHEATEQSLKILNSCYYKIGNKERREAVMEELVRRFPKPDYYTDLLQIYQTEDKQDKKALLEIYRYGFEREWISRESICAEFVADLLDAGAPAEAAKVIDYATSKGAFPVIAATDRNGRLKAKAAQQAAEDRKSIAQFDKDARAKQNGEADVSLGLAYLGLGDNDKAVEALERGLSAERVGKVKRVDDAQMMLGIAYKRLGKAEEAKKAFTAAQQSPAMAKAAALWLQSL